MKGEGIQEEICLSSWGLYPLLLSEAPYNLPVYYIVKYDAVNFGFFN